MTAAEEQRLHLLVRAIVRGVVPVEATAAFRDAHEQRDEHGAIRVLVHAREGLAGEIVDRRLHVLAGAQPLGLTLDEALHERAVLVERRRVLFERERQLLAVEDGERAEAEPAQRVVEMRGTHVDPLLTTSAPALLSGRWGTSTRCGRRRPARASG